MAGCVNSFQARHGTTAYATGAITWDASTQISDETFTANVSEVKDVTVTPPEISFEKIDCFGATAQTIGLAQQTVGSGSGVVTGKFQNQAVQTSSTEMWKISGTIVLTGDEQVVDLLGLDTAEAITGASRYSVGSLDANNGVERNTLGSIRLFLNNGSEEVTVVLTNVYMKVGDIKPTGADGYWEREFEAVCLAKDGALEFLN